MEGKQFTILSAIIQQLTRGEQGLCEPTDPYCVQPLKDILSVWNFAILGPFNSGFRNIICRVWISLSMDYLMKTSSTVWLTSQGRFETNRKISLSLSDSCMEPKWPSWSIQLVLLAVVDLLHSCSSKMAGHLDHTSEGLVLLFEKIFQLWIAARTFLTNENTNKRKFQQHIQHNNKSREIKNLATQITFQGEEPNSPDPECPKEVDMVSSSHFRLSKVVMTSSSRFTFIVVQAASDRTELSSKSVCTFSHGLSLPEAMLYHSAASVFQPWTYQPVDKHRCSCAILYPWSSYSKAGGGQIGGTALMVQRLRYSFLCPKCCHLPDVFLLSDLGAHPCHIQKPVQTSSRIHAMLSFNNNNSETFQEGSPDASSPHPPAATAASKMPPPSSVSGTQAPVSDSASYCTPCCASGKCMLSELVKRVRKTEPEESPPLGSADSVHVTTHINELTSSDVDESLGSQQQCEVIVAERIDALSPADSVQDIFKKKIKEVFSLWSEPEPVSSAVDEVLSLKARSKNITDPDKETFAADCLVKGLSRTFVGINSIIVNSLNDGRVATDSETSLIGKDSADEATGKDISHAEFQTDAEDCSELGFPPIEMSGASEKPQCERNTSSSRHKQTAKGLRHKQSFAVLSPAEVNKDNLASLDEALSGYGSSFQCQQQVCCSGVCLVSNARSINVNEARQVNRVVGEENIPLPYTSFILMIGLCVSTVFIVLNHLFYIVDLSDLLYLLI